MFRPISKIFLTRSPIFLIEIVVVWFFLDLVVVGTIFIFTVFVVVILGIEVFAARGVIWLGVVGGVGLVCAAEAGLRDVDIVVGDGWTVIERRFNWISRFFAQQRIFVSVVRQDIFRTMFIQYFFIILITISVTIFFQETTVGLLVPSSESRATIEFCVISVGVVTVFVADRFRRSFSLFFHPIPHVLQSSRIVAIGGKFWLCVVLE